MMPVSIGFRVEPTAFHWAAVSFGTDGTPILEASGSPRIPKGFSEQKALSWVRERVLHILSEVKPTSAAIKYPEQVSRSGGDNARIRSRIEGIVLQAIDETHIECFTGAYRSVSAKMGSRSAKSYLAGDSFRGLDWRGLPSLMREAVVVAAAAGEC